MSGFCMSCQQITGLTVSSGKGFRPGLHAVCTMVDGLLLMVRDTNTDVGNASSWTDIASS